MARASFGDPIVGFSSPLWLLLLVLYAYLLNARNQIYVFFKRAESFLIWNGGKVRNNFSHYMECGREGTSARKRFL